MVEGPGCTLHGEQLRARVRRGQAVRGVRGSAVLPGAAARPGNALTVIRASCQDFLTLLNGCLYTGVETLGKELFMYFGQKALRVHFGMNGSMHINPVASKNKNEISPVLEIQLTDDLVCFFDATVEIRNAVESEQKVRMMESLDVCSPKFSFLRAKSEIKQQTVRMLCDVLLDQAVLPGVGNIIKNEALFDSGLHPAIKVCQLTDEQIHHLVKMTRDFTLLFYKCRKTGSALYKHYKVYKRPNCGQCNGKITVCRLGENNRMTYFCPQCQKDRPQLVDVNKLPTRNSLIGWAYGRGSCSNEHVAQKSEEEWTCMLCTLINKPSAKFCDACLTSRPEVPKVENEEESTTFNSSLVKYPCNSFGKPATEIKVNRRTAFGTTTLILTDLGSKFSLLKNERRENKTPDGSSPISDDNGRSLNNTSKWSGSKYKYYSANSPVGNTSSPSHQQSNFSNPIQQKEKTDQSSPNLQSSWSLSSSEPGVNMTDGTCTSNAGYPRCSKHNRLCSLRVVRKDGENKGRQFYTCPLPKGIQCDYFEWADLHFPFCNHGKRCIMRTVLKIGPNNGKNFFVCPFGRDKQCDFFQWAENGPGVKIIPGC
ncbi:PREDICTED: endonuclease 8-like 3 [Gavialis gangeticus]|uniref:endonuclease 8-like 3 n=1 Tax=Gavialis gangeticus TaxID=94835 RepID=UPI00092E9CC8|nr:PREDICTED: endonuclease 8-like 3 [Gavialis gangeticus]